MRKLLLFAMLCCFLGSKAAAQTSCYTPQFSFYVTTTATIPTATEPTSTTPVTVTQTVTLSGHTVIGSQCQMPFPTVYHWATITNTLTKGTTTYSNPNTSPHVCASCQINLSSSVNAQVLIGEGVDIAQPNQFYGLDCSMVGQFGHGGGSFVSRLIQVLEGMSIPDRTRPKTNCVTGAGTGLIVCDIPVLPWCSTTATPAVKPTEIRALTNPQAQWWSSWDLCYRFTPNNTTPWTCPSWHINVPYGNLNIPLGVPFSFDHYTTPPPGGSPACDDIYKP
jgi:hypothetical protein